MIYDILSLLGHCIAILYAMARYLVNLTELETNLGHGDAVIVYSYNVFFFLVNQNMNLTEPN